MPVRSAYALNVVPFVLLSAGFYSHRPSGMPEPPPPSPPAGAFASVAWSGPGMRGSVSVQQCAAFPKGLVSLRYSLAREGREKAVIKGRDWIPERCLRWKGDGALSLRAAASDLPGLSSAGFPGEGIELRWSRKDLGWSPTGEAVPAVAEGQVMGVPVFAASSAFLEKGTPE